MTNGLFDSAAPFYGWLTDNPLWHDSIREMTRHFPPSGSTLRLIDVGGGPANSARAMLALRPDLQIAALDMSSGMLRRARLKSSDASISLIQADAMHLPFADSSADAVTAHSVYYLLKDGAAFLREAKRVLRPGGRLILLDPAQGRSPFAALRSFPRQPRAAISVLFWHAVGQAVQRVTPEGMARTLESVGFARVLGERTVEGFGVLSRGEKPYMTRPLPARLQADQNDESPDVPIIGDGIRALRSPYIFLLIRQTPAQPIWSLPPGTHIRWDAVIVQSILAGTPIALAFTALPKAVAFMQPAVTENALIGVTRIAKFPREIAAQWTFTLLLNPDYQVLRSTNRYQLPGGWLPIDPREAITGDE